MREDSKSNLSKTRQEEKEMAGALHLPVIDLASPDRLSAANSIRQACVEHGFFYLVNHGVKEELLNEVFHESSKFFSLPLEEKLKLARREHRGYTALYSENLDPESSSKGDPKESYYIGPLEDLLNQWPAEEILPSWRCKMESYYKEVECAGRNLLSLVALSLKLEEDFFHNIGALDKPASALRLLHYPEYEIVSEETYGASAHSDYGMLTLLATDGVPGLQICRDKCKKPRSWEDVAHVKGGLIVNIGDMMERWTNCLYKSTLHRVKMAAGKERYSMAFFMDPDEDCVVECLNSCCSDSSPPRFPPIRSGDHLKERLRVTYTTTTT